MNGCPSCGSGSGFVFYLKTKMYGLWGEEAEAVESYRMGDTCACETCGYRTTIRRAQGEEEEESE